MQVSSEQGLHALLNDLQISNEQELFYLMNNPDNDSFIIRQLKELFQLKKGEKFNG